MSTMDIVDWKLLTQGGFTACNIKYETARSFINHCLKFSRPNRNCSFSLKINCQWNEGCVIIPSRVWPRHKKRALEWPRKHPMDCIVWPAKKACKPDDEEETSDSTEEDQDSQAEHLNGTLPELEKEALGTMSFTDVLPTAVDSPPHEKPT